MSNDEWVNWSHNVIQVPKPASFQGVFHEKQFQPLAMRIEYTVYKRMQFLAPKVDSLDSEATLFKGFLLFNGIRTLATILRRQERNHYTFLAFVHEDDIGKAEKIGKPCNQ